MYSSNRNAHAQENNRLRRTFQRSKNFRLDFLDLNPQSLEITKNVITGNILSRDGKNCSFCLKGFQLDKDKFEEFKKNRYQVELDWYNNAATKARLIFQILQFFVIVFSVLTPVLLAINEQLLRVTAILTSGIVTILTSLLAAFKFHEDWINFRMTAESLRKELSYCKARIGDYGNSDDPEQLFVSKVEDLISAEHTAWVTIQKAPTSPPKA